MATYKKRPYNLGSVCACGAHKDQRSHCCKLCQKTWDNRLLRLLDPELTIIDGHVAKRIHLTKGQIAYVSPAKWEEVSQYNWQAWWNVKTQSFYAVRQWKEGGKHGNIHLHNAVFKAEPGKRADHISRNSLDCTDDNLRSATHAENMYNSGIHRNNTSGFKGVTWNRQRNLWRWQIRARGKTYSGNEPTKELAHERYCEMAVKLHGEFACFG